jgi:Zn-dependent protease with chaperone function
LDFFEQQAKSRRKTKWLVALFIMAVISMIVGVYLALVPLYFYSTHRSVELLFNAESRQNWWVPPLFHWTCWVTIAIVFGGSWYMIRKLAAGGSVVANMLGGRKILSATTDANEKRLLNIVQEMSIASGVPTPDVYLLDNEEAINAFAAGYSPSDTIIAVTRGTLETLTRDELQGVIGHEFSHILNGDIRLNIRLAGFLHGILCIATIGYWIMRSTPRARTARRAGLPQIGLLGLAIVIIGYLGVFFGKLIKSAVSRSREFLADASAVQFTRNPYGIINALKKIAAHTYGSKIHHHNAETMSHIFFGNAVGWNWFNLFSTHPSLNDRIRNIDPRILAADEKIVERDTSLSPEFNEANHFELRANWLSSQVGKLEPIHLAFAKTILDKMEAALVEATNQSMNAQALVLAMLFNKDEIVRTKQRNLITALADPFLSKESERLDKHLQHSDPVVRLPLLELAMPSLRSMSGNEFARFDTLINQLIGADKKLDLFEFILRKMIDRHVAPKFGKVSRDRIHYHSLEQVMPEALTALSMIAYAGNANIQTADRAFQHGLKGLTRQPFKLISSSELSLHRLDAALKKLATTAPLLKREIFTALATAVSADNNVTIREAELLRGMADALGCPMPPFVARSSAAA